MARTYGRPGKAAEFARMWSQLSLQQQRSIVAQVQAAFGNVKAAAEPEKPETEPRYKRHVRFERGQVTLLNSARSARAADAWTQLAETAAQIERGRR